MSLAEPWWLSAVEAQTLRGDCFQRGLRRFQRPGLSCVEAWWHNLRGKEDPTLKIGQSNQLNLNTNISDLNSDYVWVLKDINLEVKQGEKICIIWKKDTGKSKSYIFS